jgi:hypothetical protein
MTTLEAQLPPLAQALGRLRQPRLAPGRPRFDADAGHDLLRLMPEPALAADLPALAEPAHRPAAAAIPGPEAARTYWFDL